MVIRAGLRGAFMLARGRSEGLMLIEESPAGAGRSFWAGALCVPVFVLLRLLSWWMGATPRAGIPFSLLAGLVAEIAIWVGFALASQQLAIATAREKQWPHFLAAWNWGNAVQYTLLLGLTLPSLLGLPETLGFGLGLAAFGYALWLEWFIAKEALHIPGGRAAMFVALDLILGMFIGGFVGKITG